VRRVFFALLRAIEAKYPLGTAVRPGEPLTWGKPVVLIDEVDFVMLDAGCREHS
jgi:hypothetical protein